MSGDFYRTFGLMLQKKRIELGVSQQELADIIGVSRPTIVFIEQGKSKANTYLGLSLAKAFNILPQVLETVTAVDLKAALIARKKSKIEATQTKLRQQLAALESPLAELMADGRKA